MDVAPHAQHAAGTRRVAAGHHLEQRRLAGAVRAHHADDRRLSKTQVGRQREGHALARPAASCIPCASRRGRGSVARPCSCPQQLGGAARRRAAQRRGRTGIDDAPAVEHVDAVGDRRAPPRRSARRSAPRSPPPSAAGSWPARLHDLRRQALARLVEQHEAGRAEQGARDRDHLHLAAGQVLRIRAPPDNRAARRSRTPPSSLHGAEARRLDGDREVARDRQRREDAPVVRHPADAAARDLVRRLAA